jgi:hypothetical protein
MRQRLGNRSTRPANRGPDQPSSGAWSKLGFVFFEKVVLVTVAALAVGIIQGRFQLSQKRLEKATRISEISIDKPIAIAGGLPAHLDALIVYAEHIRSRNVEQVSSQQLTEMQAAINSDLEGSRAYFSGDNQLKAWAKTIKDTTTGVRAKALTTKNLEDEDLSKLESIRELAYRFHNRVIDLSVEEAGRRFDAAYGRDDVRAAP